MEPYQWAILMQPIVVGGLIWLIAKFTNGVIRPKMKEGRLKRILFFHWD